MPLLDFTSGYVQRSLDEFPKQGSKEPWKLRQNYVLDIRTIRRGPIDDGAMRFSDIAAARAAVSLSLRPLSREHLAHLWGVKSRCVTAGSRSRGRGRRWRRRS